MLFIMSRYLAFNVALNAKFKLSCVILRQQKFAGVLDLQG